MISAELVAYFESGVSVLVGTRDARLVPACARGVGVRVDAERDEMTFFLPEATAAETLANLAENGRVALCFSRPEDHRSIQVKGRVLESCPATAGDREKIERYRIALGQSWGWVGIPPRITFRLAFWPARAVRVHVEAIFSQTPGPGAGAELAGDGTGDGAGERPS